MQKYFEIFRVTWAEYLSYRLNFILWRFRVFLNLLIIFFLWSSIYAGQSRLFDYTKVQILTYILLSSLIANFVMGTRTTEIAQQIIQGDIINYILKPVSFFKYYLAKDLADKFINFIFAFFEIGLLIVLFKPDLYIQKDPLALFSFIILFLIGTLISFFINISLSFIGFWTTEVWAPRFIYFVLISFLSGAYFPLDILPKPLYYLLLATPFPYLYYLPTKIYLQGVSTDILYAIALSLTWVYLSYKFSKLLWQKGLKNFSFYGR